MKQEKLPAPLQFEWDGGNIDKNWKKHKVSQKECIEVFHNDPIVLNDRTHSQDEERFIAIGKVQMRYIFIIYTMRNKFIRVISARDQNKKERIFYNQKREL